MPPLKKKKHHKKGKEILPTILQEFNVGPPLKNPMISKYALEIQKLALKQGNTCQ